VSEPEDEAEVVPVFDPVEVPLEVPESVAVAELLRARAMLPADPVGEL
jgi:hypothetical protein